MTQTFHSEVKVLPYQITKYPLSAELDEKHTLLKCPKVATELMVEFLTMAKMVEKG